MSQEDLEPWHLHISWPATMQERVLPVLLLETQLQALSDRVGRRIFLFFPIQAMPEAKALRIRSKLQTKLDLDTWQDVDDCLGCTVKRDRAKHTTCIWLSQEPAAHKLLLRCNMDSRT
jgi:hypothetical protein